MRITSSSSRSSHLPRPLPSSEQNSAQRDSVLRLCPSRNSRHCVFRAPCMSPPPPADFDFLSPIHFILRPFCPVWTRFRKIFWESQIMTSQKLHPIQSLIRQLGLISMIRGRTKPKDSYYCPLTEIRKSAEFRKI